MKLTEQEIEIAGKLSALEFLLEVLYANNLSTINTDLSEKFKNDLLSRKGYIKKGPMDVSELEAIEESCSNSLANFVDKVRHREQEIRSSD